MNLKAFLFRYIYLFLYNDENFLKKKKKKNVSLASLIKIVKICIFNCSIISYVIYINM